MLILVECSAMLRQDGKISIDELEVLMGRVRSPALRSALLEGGDIQDLMNRYDRQYKGYLTPSEALALVEDAHVKHAAFVESQRVG